MCDIATCGLVIGSLMYIELAIWVGERPGDQYAPWLWIINNMKKEHIA
jgi:hypothetical protein